MSRTRIMTVLLLLLCGALVYAWIATPQQNRVTTRKTARQSVKHKNAVVNLAATAVADLDFSQGTPPPFNPPIKSLFSPLYLPPKPGFRPPPPPPNINTPVPVAAVVKAEPAVALTKSPDPIQPLKVLGFLNKDGNYTVFLGAEQGKVYIVNQGDKFLAGLSVDAITPQQITIVRKETDQQVFLQMGKAKSQRLPTVGFSSGRPKFEMPAEPKAQSSQPKVINKLPAENPFSNAIKKLGN